MSDPFEDLENLDDETESEADSKDTSKETDTATSTTQETPSEQEDTEKVSWKDTPGFPFDICDNRTFYARDDVMETFDETIFEVEVILRQEHGLKDFETREFYDALIRSAEAESIADLIIDQRKTE